MRHLTVDTTQIILDKLQADEFPLEQLKTLNFLVRNQECDPVLIAEVYRLAQVDQIHPKIWGLCEYTLGDFALATLYWLPSDEALQMYRQLMTKIEPAKNSRVKQLIEAHMFEYF